jgi:pimeloyl-ACP methyl ester carboxylesterase
VTAPTADAPDPFRSIPAAAADLLPVAGENGATLHLHRLKTTVKSGPALLCGHATGMAAGSYLPFLRMLAERVRVYAVDMRGHGGSDCGPGLDAEAAAATVTLDALARDLHAVADRVREDAGTDDLFYAAHSISGVAALHLGTMSGRAGHGHAPWRDLILFEPPVMVGPEHPLHAYSKADTIKRAAGTARRRADWDSPAALYGMLKTRGVFQRFRPEMLEAHVHATLCPKASGGYRLACEPLVESAFFKSVPESGVWDRLPDFPLPARFVGGDPDLPDPGGEQARWVTVAAPDIAARVPGSRFTVVADTDHMMLCERPDACRDLVFSMIDEAGR